MGPTKDLRIKAMDVEASVLQTESEITAVEQRSLVE